MSSSILVEEVGIGTPNIINEHNLNTFVQFPLIQFRQSVVDYPAMEDVEIPDEPLLLPLDIDMEPPIIVMEADDSSCSNEFEMLENLNKREDTENKIIIQKSEQRLGESSDDVPFEFPAKEPSQQYPIDVVYPEEFASETIIELSRQSWGTSDPNYLRGCVWSPDGTCILTPVNKDGMHVIELPTELYAVDELNTDRPLDILSSAVHVPENGTVYDFCWYPFMNSSAPESCCWISTQQHGPIQMWDAFDGKLRCSYRGYDAVDEVEAALCVSFSIDGTSIIGGYRKSLKIFRTDTPGRDFTSFSLKSPASCLAVHHTQEDVIAIGSWNGTVSLHDVRSPKLEVVDQFARPKAGGVTMTKFSADGQQLFVGSRKDDVLSCWDVRKSDSPLYELRRTVGTNQRIQFDISSSGRWIVSGDTGGVVRAWEVNNIETVREFQFPLHNDCCNGVSLHPSRPILATVSGQHHFDSDVGSADAVTPKVIENSLIFWWFGKTYSSSE